MKKDFFPIANAINVKMSSPSALDPARLWWAPSPISPLPSGLFPSDSPLDGDRTGVGVERLDGMEEVNGIAGEVSRGGQRKMSLRVAIPRTANPVERPLERSDKPDKGKRKRSLVSASYDSDDESNQTRSTESKKIYYTRKCEQHRHRVSREEIRACQRNKGGCRRGCFQKTSSTERTQPMQDEAEDDPAPQYPPRLQRLFAAFRNQWN